MCRKIQPSALSPQPSALSPQPSALNIQKALIIISKFRKLCIKFVCILFILTPFAHARSESGYHPFGETGLFPSGARRQEICFGSKGCYLGYEINQIFPSGEAGCNAVLNSRYSDGKRNFIGYGNGEFSLLSWGSIYTDFVGNVYPANQCILKTSGGGFTFTTSCGFGIFGTCHYPNFVARELVRCDTNGVADAYWFSPEDAAKICTSNTLTLTPAPNQKDPRPLKAEGKDGKSTYELIAKVTDGSAPKAGVAVTFKVDVVPMTGGHGHHDESRPKGSVLPSGVTDANGEIKLTFQASEVAGSHTIMATCNDCTNKTIIKNVDARVPDLQPLSPNPPQNAEGKYLYALTAIDPKHVGTSGGRQRGEYYLTAKAIDNLQILVKNFAAENWGTVAFNDASLVWGGLYDIDNDWMESHQGHRLGEEIDISFTRANNPISVEKRKKIYKTLCDDKKVSVPFKILYHIGGAGPHYHVYLLGRKQGCFTLPT